MRELFFSKNLKYLRELNNKTQDDVAKLCNKTNTAISNWEKGIREPDAIDIAKISTYFNVSIDDIILKNLRFDNATLLEPESETIQIPVLGIIKAGIPIEAQEAIIEYIDIPKAWTNGGKRFYGLQIAGDSMMPKYQEKDIVIFEYNLDYVLANGKDCAVMVNGYDATFKNVTISEDGITLVPLNINNIEGYKPTFYSKEQIEQLPVKIIGIAKEKRTKL